MIPRSRLVAVVAGLALTTGCLFGCTSPTGTSTGVILRCGVAYGTVSQVIDLTSRNSASIREDDTALIVFTRHCRTLVTIVRSVNIAKIVPASGDPPTAFFITVGRFDGELTVRVGPKRRTIEITVVAATP